MKKYLLIALFLFAPLPALAEGTLAIVATVNDEAITSADLDGRVRLAMLGSGIRPGAEAQARLREQLLRQMIDERLQLQEASRLNITVDNAMIDREIADLAQRNNQKPEQLPAFFARSGVPISALKEQIRANIAWALVVQRRLRPQVNVTDRDIDAEISRQGATAGQPEYLVAEIFLPVQRPQDDSSVKQSAFRLIDQMAKGARFSGIAREFSQSPSAVRGGDLGWLRPGQLDPELDAALTRLGPGTLSPPVRTSSGYHILMLREQRLARAPGTPDPLQSTLALRQVLLPVGNDAPAAAVAAASSRLEKLRVQAKTCADMERLARAQGDSRGGDLGNVKFAELPPALQPVLAGLPDSQPSPPLRNDRGVLFLMICSRTGAAGAAASVNREEIAQAIGARRLELLVRRTLRDLRQDAFIDIRG